MLNPSIPSSVVNNPGVVVISIPYGLLFLLAFLEAVLNAGTMFVYIMEL